MFTHDLLSIGALGRWERRPRDMGKGPRNIYGIVMDQEEVAMFLCSSARDYHHVGCDLDVCDVCDSFCDEWHELYRQLDGENQELVDVTLAALGVKPPQWHGSPF